MPRRNSNATQSDFEKMSGAKVKALLEALQYEWRQRTNPDAERPAPRERW